MLNDDFNAWAGQAVDYYDGEPKAVQVALISACNELAVKFNNAFETARLFSRATDHGENRGGNQLTGARATDHGENRGVIQLMQNTVEQIVAIPVPLIMERSWTSVQDHFRQGVQWNHT